MSVASGYLKYKRHIKQSDGTYKLVSHWTSAKTVEFANGLTLEDSFVELTQAQYNALSTTQKNNGTTYFVTDAGDISTANNVEYNNGNSGLSATNVQGAIDELNSDLFVSNFNTLKTTITNNSYTATEDCIVQVETATSNANFGIITTRVNDRRVRVYQNPGAQANLGDLFVTYVKKGDTVSVSGAGGYVLSVYTK